MRKRSPRILQMLALLGLLVGSLSLTGLSGAQTVIKDVTINFVETTRLSNLRTEVRAYVTVTDLSGAPVVGLAEDDFTLTENGVTVRDFQVQEASAGVWVVLLMDTTSSMHEDGLQAAKAAADRFVASMTSPDQVALYQFQEEPELLEDFTPDHNRVRNAITRLKLVDKWTCLYDAASTAVKKAMEIPQGRRAVVLLTDGRDDREGRPCSTATADDVISLAFSQRVPLYVIGLGSLIDEPVLRRMAERTGGAYWSAPSPEDLAAAYQQLAQLLRQQYLLRYESTSAAGDQNLVVRVEYQGQQRLDAASYLIPELPATTAPTVAPPGDTAVPPTVEPTPPITDDGPVDKWLIPGLALLGFVAVVGVTAVVMRQRSQKAAGEWKPGGERLKTDDLRSLARLTVLESITLSEGKPFELYSTSVTIGRGAENDIDIDDRPVSRKHAELRYEDGEFCIYDRGSTYGTRVNGIEVPPQGVRLTDGDLLQLGTKTKLRFNRASPETEDGDLTVDVDLEDGTTGEVLGQDTDDDWPS